jgi:nucleoid-associated protein YgaU
VVYWLGFPGGPSTIVHVPSEDGRCAAPQAVDTGRPTSCDCHRRFRRVVTMSDPSPVSKRSITLQVLLTALVLGFVIVGVAVLLLLRSGEVQAPRVATAERIAPPSSAASRPLPTLAPATSLPEPPIKPSFDVVRVSPQGDAVMAGHAAPGAEVSIVWGGEEIGRVQADKQGAWVFVSSTPLSPGGQELTLSEHDRAGRDIKGDGSVSLVVPEATQMTRADAQPTGPIAVLSRPNTAPVTLQAAPGAGRRGAGPSSAALPKTGAASRLSLEALEYDDRGEIRFAGNAPAGSSVRVYSDRQPIGDATAGPDGHWTLKPLAPIAPGTHDLRVDQLTARGQVAARVHMPFQREQLAERDIAEGSVVVQPGQNLWRLARRAYGTGIRYTVIYQANQDQIRDPDLIYPGQTFAIPVPEEGGGAASSVAPATPSISR